MTIQEAIRSGKRVKRPLQFNYQRDFRYLTKEDILATDWEIEIVKKELSAEDVEKALTSWYANYSTRLSIYEYVLKELGF